MRHLWEGRAPDADFQRLRDALDGASDADGLIYLGVNVGVQGLTDEALACFDAALSHNPSDPDTWHNKGVVLGRLGRDEEAEATFEQEESLRSQASAPGK